MTWSIRWTRPGERDLRRIDPPTQRRIHDAITRLAEQGHGDLRRLVGRDQQWRLRVGDHRVILQLDAAAHVAIVLRVRHRSDAYRE